MFVLPRRGGGPRRLGPDGHLSAIPLRGAAVSNQEPKFLTSYKVSLIRMNSFQIIPTLGVMTAIPTRSLTVLVRRVPRLGSCKSVWIALVSLRQ